jgi:membrane-bound metal-dependent hydrolase YbcI (DUF457 family)
MGNFDEHFNAGKTVGLLAAVAGIFLVLDRGGSIGEAIIIAAGIGSILVIGSILPDIDHHASKPRQAAGNLGVLMVVGGAIGLVIFAPDIVARLGGIVNSLGISGSPIFLGIGVLIVVAIVLLTTGGDAFDSLTKHRGGTHSLPFVGLVGLVTLLASQKLANFGGILGVFQGLNGVLLAAAAAGGVLVHLIVDS